MSFRITIDGRDVEVRSGMSVLDAARKLGIDIPTLCHLEKCGPLNSCLVCLVKLDGRLVPSCGTEVRPGMVVESETPEVHDARRTALELLFSDHVGDCLAPCNRLCPLQLNVPLMIRQMGQSRPDQAIVTVRQALPLPRVLGRLCNHPCEQGCRRGAWDTPIAIRNLEREVADADHARPAPYVPTPKPPTGKTVAVVGAGPTGLAASWFLALDGHTVTVLDRHQRAGGSLRSADPTALPPEVLDSELDLYTRLGIKFELGAELGSTVRLESLVAGFDVVLLATGELSTGEKAVAGVEMTGRAIKADPETMQTPLPRLFAAGSAVRPARHLIRTMAEGKSAAYSISLALAGKPPKRPDKPFSSVMGRLEPAELNRFVHGAAAANASTQTEKQIGQRQFDAQTEPLRCLHCDCRAAGNCDLQRYGELYGVNTARFAGQRRQFEQQAQPGGVIFEPGKCILCGICVKLTELAAEPLGLTFVGRGFNVRLAAPFDRSIDEGLRRVAAECIRCCPTGALSEVQ